MESALLQSLADKQAIYEVVLRYCRGIDRLDMALVRSAFHPDAIDNHVGYAGPVEGFIAFVEPSLHGFTGSMHILCNHLVEIDGDVAASETYALGVHWGEPADKAVQNFTMGFRYVDHMTRRNGVWAIQERWVACEWARSDVGVPKMTLPGRAGTRGPDDPLTALRSRLGLV
jgi:hypothetical protein